MPDRPRALFALDPHNLPLLFPPDVLARLRELADIDPALVVRDFEDPGIRDALAGAEFLVTGWGCPPITAPALERLPRLRAVLHTGGTVKGLIPGEGWRHDIVVTSAAAANALPVAEYTLAMILLMGKDVLTARDHYRATEAFPPNLVRADIGNVGRRVGIIGASRIGRRVIELLRPFDFDVVLHDPYVDEAGAAALGVRLSDFDALLASSAIVSVHAPATAETHHLIDAARLALLPDGAALINTARGSLVDTEALTRELVSGRIRAVLDVTEPEPLSAGSPLYRLPNVFLTPHVAGSLGNELRRLGVLMVEELRRIRSGAPPEHRVDLAQLEITA
ncbi:hydroxyacid dehydrogenase [Streptomyces litchfieldiae]|uniref:Hydroxyacid dehydrogenase n=1 Tax=Streptomyces litchfieldiae TaxID=3075543 RepID=A0ABU2MM07_9ACTN|nr:hydroxyacid dehydrogenase [Streptomyces sp. DSM 44938]MDT0342447.1 hydroxyacid dehydrogenase [Streptomyces sp. DSM 44938]